MSGNGVKFAQVLHRPFDNCNKRRFTGTKIGPPSRKTNVHAISAFLRFVQDASSSASETHKTKYELALPLFLVALPFQNLKRSQKSSYSNPRRTPQLCSQSAEHAVVHATFSVSFPLHADRPGAATTPPQVYAWAYAPKRSGTRGASSLQL